MNVDATPEDVGGQLDRLLESGGLAQSERLKRFLRYVVERTLAGDGDRLKEYLIGVDVFDRDESYDPRMDSIVRVEAGRLRSKLDEYYSGAGANDPVIIRIPRGSYVAVFERRSESAPASIAPAVPPAIPHRRTAGRGLVVPVAAAAILLMAIAAWRTGMWNGPDPSAKLPAIAVLPFTHYSANPGDERLAAQISEGVMSELARIGTVSVVSRTSVQQFAGARQPLRQIAAALGADMLIESSLLRTGTTVRVDARLVDGRSDRKIWAQDFSAETSDVRGLQQRIARAAAAAVAKHAARTTAPR